MHSINPGIKPSNTRDKMLFNILFQGLLWSLCMERCIAGRKSCFL